MVSADDLVPPGARASAGIVLTWLSTEYFIACIRKGRLIMTMVTNPYIFVIIFTIGLQFRYIDGLIMTMVTNPYICDYIHHWLAV